jgi:DNA invertase Pin-like site-specific DNA recombinase
VRVSRTAGRGGESFISPEVQRQKIEAWGQLHGVEIVRWWEELDQSGKKRDRPMFQEALARCERRESGGIVVARLDRFARSAMDALESIKRLNEAGSRLVSVEDNFDGSTPMGRFAIGILTLIAELELERITENWDTAVTEAVKRGVHISARVPVGYRKLGKSKGLEPVEPAASVVADVFRKRAVGASYSDLARFLEQQGVLPSTGNPHWSPNGVVTLLKNRVYLGEARSGKAVNPRAHPAIVTRAEFDAAQAARSVLPTPKTALASLALLKGLARCAGCGHTLKITGTYLSSAGRRVPSYYCHGRYATGLCPARATIISTKLDPYVETIVVAALRNEGGPLAEAAAASDQLEAVRREVDEAEHELALYIEADLISVVGREVFRRGVETRQRAVDNARATLAELQHQSQLGGELASGDLLEAWPTLTVQEKRLLLHGLLDRVVVARANGRGKNTPPTEERVTIVLRGGLQLEPDAIS